MNQPKLKMQREQQLTNLFPMTKNSFPLKFRQILTQLITIAYLIILSNLFNQEATTVAKPIKIKCGANTHYDKVSGRRIEKEYLDFSCPLDELSFLGSGYPLFFHFMKYSIYILCVMLVVTGGYAFDSNYIFSDECDSNDQKCYKDYHLVVTIANKYKKGSYMRI